MSQGTLWLQPINRVFTSTAAPVAVAGAKAFFYLAGTLTSVSVFSDVGLTTPITQPVVADGNGIFVEIFITPGVAYKVDIQTALGVSLTGYPADNQLAIPLSSSFVAFSGTAGETLTAGLGVYLSDGSGGKNAGQWYKWDTANPYSSTLPELGIVPSAIASGVAGTIQQGGQVPGLSGLSVGSAYWVSTSGALTSAQPASNARFVGQADSATTLVLSPNPRPINAPNIVSIAFSDSPYTALAGSGDSALITCNATSGAITVNLFAASGNAGRRLTIKKTDASANAVTIDGNASETIDGALTLILSLRYEDAVLECDGSNWQVIAQTPVFFSWTPTFGGSGGQTGQVYAEQLGRGTKKGKDVTLNGRMRLSTLGTITTNVQVQGFPVAADGTAGYRFAGVVGSFESLNTSYVGLWLDGVASATAATVYAMTAASTSNAVIAQSNLTANSGLTFTISYVSV